MLEKRVKIQTVIEQQLPDFVSSENQRFGDFLKTYYKSAEYQGGPIDILDNIDQYVKVGTYTSIIDHTILTSDVDSADVTINVASTNGWPDSYGLLKIDNEIISYTDKTSTTFNGCIRGFSGITSYRGLNAPDELIFESSLADNHVNNAQVINVSSLFLKEFLKKLKTQFLPGFEDRELNKNLNIANFIRQSKDFYTSKGTEDSFEILFKALYGDKVEVIKPQENLFIPSDAGYQRVLQLNVDSIDGNLEELSTKTIYQEDQFGNTIAYGSVVDVENIKRDGKEFYRINVDFNEDKDIVTYGSLYGKFIVDPQTKVIDNVSSGSTFINVESTIGFTKSGELYITYSNGSVGIVTYNSKNITQFLDINGVSEQISDTQEIYQNNFAYGYNSDGEEISFRIKGSIGEYTVKATGIDTPYFIKNDIIKLQSLGYDKDNKITDSLITNESSTFDIKNARILSSNQLGQNPNIISLFQIETFEKHGLNIGDTIQTISPNGYTTSGIVNKIISDFTFDVSGLNGFNTINKGNVKRILTKVYSQNNTVSELPANVVKSFYDDNDSVYVASNSLPSYRDPINVKTGIINISDGGTGNGIFISGDTIPAPNHNFLTGDEVYYVPDKFVELVGGYGEPVAITTERNLGDLREGNYFVKVVDSNNIKLSPSRSEIFNNRFANVSGIASFQQIYPIKSYKNSLDSSYGIRKIPFEVTETSKYHEVSPGIVGIFINGVDILSYKSEDFCYYGNITGIDITSGGNNYDVINPPKVIIEDSVGSGATATATVVGQLESIEVLDGGSDFTTNPIITITGGNGSGCVAKANTRKEKIIAFTNTSSGSGFISTSTNIIGFSTYHRFRNGDAVVYSANSQTPIGIGTHQSSLIRDANLVDSSVYYVSSVSLNEIKLHVKQPDALSGINTINITDFGEGNQYFTTVDLKNILSSITVSDKGFGYTNNPIRVSSSGISSSKNQVTYNRHGFSTGELIVYEYEGVSISGLTTDQNYYVNKVDDNNFKLSAAGIGTTISNYNFTNNIFVDFKNVGVGGTHIFNYPKIEVKINGNVGIDTTDNSVFQPTVRPKFRGYIQKINLEKTGIEYGSSDIINFERQPLILFETGSGAQLKPIISNGSIKEVFVINGGTGYTSQPDLKISGSGSNASLTPVVQNGSIVSIQINDGGSGFTTHTTFIDAIPTGQGAKSRARIRKWTINNFERYKNNLSVDDGILTESKNQYSRGSYASMSVPRALRELIYAKNEDGQTKYGADSVDLRKINNVEVTSEFHSPIIGWSFDGHPIYGPFAYDTPRGGTIREMRTGYELIPSSERPPGFANGYFIEDYVFTDSGDLDEKNGRFSKTPDYPFGTYAYYTTINPGPAEGSGSFKNYKLPQFPYVIGNSFKGKPDPFNFDRNVNQIDYNYDLLYRNTRPTKTSRSFGYSDYINDYTSDPKQIAEITSVSKGSVTGFSVVSAGSSYKPGDRLIIDGSPLYGRSATAKIKSIRGKKIVSLASSTLSAENIGLYVSGGLAIGYCTSPHNFENKNSIIISGLSTHSYSNLNGNKIINNPQRTWYLGEDLDSPSTTGLTTTISLIGSYDPLYFRENTIIGIGLSAENLEKLKVLNVDPQNQLVRVQRNYDNTIGAAYSARTLVLEYQSTFSFPIGFTTNTSNPPKLQRYFNPSEVVGLGTSISVGIGTTISYHPVNNIAPPNIPQNNHYQSGIAFTTKVVSLGSILIQNHSFETGDELVYSNGGGSSLRVWNGVNEFDLLDESIVYAIKDSDDVIGLSTTKVGLGSTGTYVGLGSTSIKVLFVSVGSGVTHSLTLQTNPVIANASVYESILITEDNHGLTFQDQIAVVSKPNKEQRIFVQYNDFNRRIVFDRKKFEPSGINTVNNTINLPNHGLDQSQKIIFNTTGSAPNGLVDNEMYYAIPIDSNNIKLTNQKVLSYSPNPTPIRISSFGSGEHFISKVNPPINVYRGNLVSFAVTDSSLSATSVGTRYPAFKLEFFKDNLFGENYISTKTTKEFEVVAIGTVGTTDPAAVNISTNDITPGKLYYKFSPVNIDKIPSSKSEIFVDEDQSFANTIEIIPSVYNAVQYPTGIGSTTFRYLLNEKPESASYSSSDGTFYYVTNSTGAAGPIESVEINGSGSGYITLPGISSIVSKDGINGIVRLSGNMGRLTKTSLRDTGHDYPSDPTFKIIANPPEILEVEALNSFESIGIITGGRDFLVPPNLIVLDPITNTVIQDVSLVPKLKNGTINRVDITRNTKSLSDTKPNIITTNNSNGVGISTIGFNTTTKEVTVQFSVGFSTDASFPFSAGDRVFVENIGISSDGTGYNSSDYNYTFFELTSVDPNIGGIGSATYKLDSSVTNPGSFSTDRSYGRMIPYSSFPVFDPKLIKNDFSVGEEIVTISGKGSAEGTVSSWDKTNKILKVNSKKEFIVGDKIRGKGSGSDATVVSKINVDSYFNIDASPLVIKGWRKDSGKLSLNEQRLIDSDYYQYFSYSLKSKIAYETWNDVVSALNHTSGFKKFSDLIIESKSDSDVFPQIDSNEVESIIDLISEVETYCVFDFDLVSEKSKEISGITFSDEILLRNMAITDYEESVGNRVLSIDDNSNSFNNTPRAERYSVIDRFPLVSSRFRKYFVMANDTQFVDERQMAIIELLIDDNGNGYVQEYGDVQTQLDGYFDFQILGSEGQLLFYPTNYEFNDYDLHGLVYNIDRGTHSSVGIATLVGVHTVGDIVSVESRGTTIPTGITTAVNILGFSTANYDSAKLLIEIEHGNRHEVLNMNLVHNRNNVYGVEYGHIVDSDLTTLSGPSLGTFGANISGGIVYLNFTPVGLSTVGSAITFSIISTKFHAGVSTVGIDTTNLTNGDLKAQYTDIPAVALPGITTIATFGTTPDEDGAYGLIQIYDVTRNRYELVEGLFLSDTGSLSYQTLFGAVEDDDDNVQTGIGTIGVMDSGGGLRSIVYKPPAARRTIVKTFLNTAAHTKGGLDEIRLISLTDSSIESVEGSYTGTQTDVLRAFGLFHGGDPIFIKNFDGSNPTIVDTTENLIYIPNHFFTSGERLRYVPLGTGTTSSIGIGTTTVSGFGSTDRLPEYVYAIKVDDKSIRVAGSAEDALISNTGNYLKLTSVGVGNSHSFIAQDQNSKCIIALDNNIQDPVIPANITHTLVEDMSFGGELMRLSGITSFYGGDLLKVEDEFMTVKQVGFGSTNVFVVQRGWMGTGFSTHPIGATVEKYEGSYNIVGNTINYYTAPNGKQPLVNPNDPDELDWTGIQTSSTFQGRVFIRNGVIGASTHTYATNYIFDSISPDFTGVGKTFTLKQEGLDVSGFSTSHSLILINDIAQIPSQGSRINDFALTENAGITSIVFSGYGASVRNDVRTGTVPVGGILASLGSSQGFGYQPLVQAGGTAIISGFGTIVSISIGNSGSGYRSGISTLNGVVQEITVNVGVRTADLDIVDVVSIGTASISNGRITGIAVTNPGFGYTFTNPPIVIIDEPIPYTNIPLIYHPESTGAGFGTNAIVNIQVSFGSSAFNFDVINSGYGYRAGETLTIPTGGLTGIPTDPTVGAGFSDFRLFVNTVSFDKFTAWRFGDLDVLDNLDPQFDGIKKVFVLKKEGQQFTIRSKKGSLIDVEQTIIVFLNNVLQEPGKAYIFPGGSNITFSESPKVGDTCSILFYKGTGNVDVISRDILETIKVGDKVRIGNGNFYGVNFDQVERNVTGILTADNFATSPYTNSGLTTDSTIQRPMTWCKQQEDLIIDGNQVNKNRILYEASIIPNSTIIKPVGLGSTEIWVQNVLPLFDSYNESLEDNKQIIEISEQKDFVGASATAVVSGFGTISSISITYPGIGYTIAPSISIANPVGMGSTTRASAVATLSGDGIGSVTIISPGSAYTFTNPPSILIEQPKFDKEVIFDVDYSGDFGVITGITTISVGLASTGLVFDLLIPIDSPLRSSAYVGPAGIQTISNIASGYPFVVYNSNVGNGVTSLDLSGSTYGIGTSFLDNVYEAVSVSIATTDAVGFGTTYVAKVVVSVSDYNGLSGIGYSDFYGQYSWGKLRNFTRSGIAKTFSPILDNGLLGISTSPIVVRRTPLKSVGYLT
jgi:hypothetical protein